MADMRHIQSQLQSVNLGSESQSRIKNYSMDLSGNNSIDSGIHSGYSSYDGKPQNGRYPRADYQQNSEQMNRKCGYQSNQDICAMQRNCNARLGPCLPANRPSNRELLHQKSSSATSLCDRDSKPQHPEVKYHRSQGQCSQGHGSSRIQRIQESTKNSDSDSTPTRPAQRLNSTSPCSDNSSSTCTEPDMRNPYEDHIYSEIGSLSRTPLSFHSKTRRRLSWGEGGKKDKKETQQTDNYATFLERYPRLVELEYVPWGEQEVLNILREGRTKLYSGHITVEMMHRLSALLQKPLVRISREAQRLASTFRRCTRHDVQSAMKVILSRSLYESCVQACMKAVTLYAMGGGPIIRDSKSQHCGLKVSVGRIHRWMQDAHLAVRVQEEAAIFMAACIENLLEEIVLRALCKEEMGDSVFPMESLDRGIATSPDLWGLLQPYEHLVCGRTASGTLSFPSSCHSSPSSLDSSPQLSGEDASPSTCSSSGVSSAGSLCSLMLSSSPDGSLESRGMWGSGLLATCVGSVPELSELVSQSMAYWQRAAPSSPSSSQRPLVTWAADALHVLYHYLRCSQVAPHSNPKLHQGDLKLTADRPAPVQAPLLEWVRVTVAHTEHRCGLVVDGDDVMQAARVLLPDTQCPPRQLRLSSECWRSTQQPLSQCSTQIQQDMAFSMLCTGRSDLLPQALRLLGPQGVDTCNDQGLTPLMCACLHGDEAMVHMLLEAGASVNKPVPNDSQKYPGLLPDIRHWTALTFATLLGHISILQLLLERGADIEGHQGTDGTQICETPLQVAAAAGHYEVVMILLNKGADPFLTSVSKISHSCGNTLRSHTAFTLAAMHGHRQVLRKLITQPKSKADEVLSLEEILAEGQVPSPKKSNDDEELLNSSRSEDHHYYCNQYFPSGTNKHNHNNSPRSNSSLSNSPHGSQHSDKINSEENIYMTIDEVMVQTINRRNEEKQESGQAAKHSREHSTVSTTSTTSSTSASHKFSKTEYRNLQEAMYHAAENGYLDIALELRSLGISWSLHTWSQCLWAAHSLQRKAIVQCLLKDFLATSTHDDLNMTFVYECLPLMCHIFRNSKNEVTGQQLANILSSLYGNTPIPPIPPIRNQAIARIDPVYVNNPEMSDIQFVIEGKTFHGHKIILVNASSHMRALLEEAHRKSSQEGTTLTKIDIHDVKFKTFEMMMKYLYNGSIENNHLETKEMLDLLKAAHVYELSALKRHCEILLSRRLHVENCTAIYKHAKVYQALELLSYCEAFFLQNLTQLLNSSDGFRKLLYSYKMLNYDLVNGLLASLSQTLEDRLNHRTKGSTFV